MRIRVPRLSGWLLPILAMVWLVGCAGGGESSGGESAAPQDPPVVPAGFTGIVWQWTDAVSSDADGGNITVSNPEAYTIVFHEDGTVDGQADCNSYGGSYTMTAGGAMSITLGHSTSAACGEESLDREFLDLLSGVVAGGPDADGLTMTSTDNKDTLHFRDGGTP